MFAPIFLAVVMVGSIDTSTDEPPAEKDIASATTQARKALAKTKATLDKVLAKKEGTGIEDGIEQLNRVDSMLALAEKHPEGYSTPVGTLLTTVMTQIVLQNLALLNELTHKRATLDQSTVEAKTLLALESELFVDIIAMNDPLSALQNLDFKQSAFEQQMIIHLGELLRKCYPEEPKSKSSIGM